MLIKATPKRPSCLVSALTLALLLAFSLGLSACSGTQTQVRGQHDVVVGGVIRK